ncbi:hypothetical protein P20439_0181 [Pseudoalteromonas sp. BSi20439]|nr:hypothetical protein P20439_0181 [Pseudoalteromonas sp. BSi20439]
MVQTILAELLFKGFHGDVPVVIFYKQSSPYKKSHIITTDNES